MSHTFLLYVPLLALGLASTPPSLLEQNCGVNTVIPHCIAIDSDSVQSAAYDGEWECANPKVKLVLNTKEENVEVPDYGFLGTTHGYMAGTGLYGTWIVTTCAIDKDAVRLRFANDTGGDVQNARLTLQGDTALLFEATGSNALRYVVKRKLVKAPSTMVFHRPGRAKASAPQKR